METVIYMAFAPLALWSVRFDGTILKRRRRFLPKRIVNRKSMGGLAPELQVRLLFARAP